ncbi:MAG TPA: hypothetical protein VMS17_18230 [Gemmataceae bacterium]|nr:hypothetical protein [Gemmataceae bacterium]
MRETASASGVGLPRWIIVAGSAAILLHFTAVVVPILDAQSGPWPTPNGPSLDDPPAFAHAAAGLAEWHASYLRTSNDCHFIFNRPGRAPGVRVEVRLRDADGRMMRNVDLPEPQANPWLRHREELLVRQLAPDLPVPPPGMDMLPPPGKAGPTTTVWLTRDDVIPGWTAPDDADVQFWMATIPQHLVPRNREVMRPSEWAVLLARSYSRRLCRETGAARAEVVRITREPMPPLVLFGNMPPPDAFVERSASFGEVTP